MSGAGQLLFLSRDAELPADYTILGEITSGMEVLAHDSLDIKSVRVR